MSVTQAKYGPKLILNSADVFEALIKSILNGHVKPGGRLPPERTLAVELSTSRPTVRQALRRLADWGMVEVRQGSGAAVRPVRYWSFEVLPTYLSFGEPLRNPRRALELVRQMLAIRRGLLVEMLKVVGPSIDPEALQAAYFAVDQAWSWREDTPKFIQWDFDAIRCVMEAAGFLPAVWLLSSVASVYERIALKFSIGTQPPKEYLTRWRAILGALEQGKTVRAVRLLGAYLERHDKRLLQTLGANL